MTMCDEKTALLSHVVLVVPGEVVTVPADVVVAAAISADPWKGLTNRELVRLAQEPFWVRLRLLAFWAFWMCWLTLLLAALSVVFTSPRCAELPIDNSTLATTTGTIPPGAWTTLTTPS